MTIIWVFFNILSYLLFYLTYKLYNDFYVISSIYQRSITISVLDNYHIIDGVKTTNNLLGAYIGIIGCILYVFDFLFIFYIKSKIINENWKLLFIKIIFGERFYNYFMRLCKYGSKTNLIWIYYFLFLLIFGGLLVIYINYFLIFKIDIITEIYEISKKKINLFFLL